MIRDILARMIKAGIRRQTNIARAYLHAAFVHGAGRVLIDGKEWAAESEDGAPLELEAIVEVTGLSGGSRLRVRAQR